ncbi:hypothetical protein [Amycolatopsis samaneae]|uniref:Uncharacterized protein n=1 Tax=Amycolatopsis samaneae TaxID=664691 RepID=A0ABW5GXB3_9PSEU
MPASLTAEQTLHTLHDLLHGRGQEPTNDDVLPGAELVVTEDGAEVYRAALARHVRRDLEDPDVIWIRPLAPGGHDPESALPTFDPAICRRRALHLTDAHLAAPRLELRLATGQQATIRPAEGPQLTVLQNFDTWMITLRPAERRGLETLAHD